MEPQSLAGGVGLGGTSGAWASCSCTQNLRAAARPLPRLPQARRVSVQASCGASARAAQGPGPRAPADHTAGAPFLWAGFREGDFC